jgi:hypothetical protein
MAEYGWSDSILEESENLEDFHFKGRLKEVYPQLMAYEKDLTAKIERLNQDLIHVRSQIAAIEKVLKVHD